MRSLGLFLHTSLDGFVAGPKGEMDWITVDAELFDYTANLTGNADTYLMGRTTYQMMEAYWPKAGEQPNASKHDIEHSKWYNNVHKVVISRSLHERDLPSTTIIGKNLEQEVLQLKKLPGKDIIMFGSPTAAHYLMKHDLIDEYGLFVNPVLLGHGIPMFHDIDEILDLKPSSTRAFSSGVVCLRYQRNRS